MQQWQEFSLVNDIKKVWKKRGAIPWLFRNRNHQTIWQADGSLNSMTTECQGLKQLLKLAKTCVLIHCSIRSLAYREHSCHQECWSWTVKRMRGHRVTQSMRWVRQGGGHLGVMWGVLGVITMRLGLLRHNTVGITWGTAHGCVRPMRWGHGNADHNGY